MHPLKEKHQALVAQYEKNLSDAQSLLAGDVTADTHEKAMGLIADNEQLKAQIESINQLSKAEGFVNETKTSLPFASSSAVMVGQDGTTHGDGKGETFTDGGLSISEKVYAAINESDYKHSFMSYVRGKGDRADFKTLSIGTDTAGGYLAPDEYIPSLIQKTAAPTRINGLVSRFPTSSPRVTMPRVVYTTDDIYTSGIRVTLTGETPSAGSAHRVTDPVFGTTSVLIGTWMMSMPITNDLIEDAAFPVLSWSAGKFNETVGLLFDNQIINGTGIGAYPHGILKNPGGTNEPVSYVSGTADTLDADQIMGLPFRLPEQYINDNTRWVMNRASGGRTVKLLKDGANRYLWERGGAIGGSLENPAPDLLDGYPVTYSAFCPDVGNGLFPAFFGDLRGYYLVINTGFSVQALSERYAEENVTLLLGRLRFGGVCAEPHRIVVAKSDNS